MKRLTTQQIVVLITTVLVTVVIIFYLANVENRPSPRSFFAEDLKEIEIFENSYKIIGKSVEGRNIEQYTFGNGDQHLLFIGGIHGGYEWNSILLAYRFIDYFNANSEEIPTNIKITIIPNANPDGLFRVIGKDGIFSQLDTPSVEETIPGRFNANGVDLNRNFDCKWQPESTWRGEIVSAGSEPFSEPEARVIRDFVLSNYIDAAIFWHSQANTVYASECENGVLPKTTEIMNIYSEAADYFAVEFFNAYEITGDVEGWLASINIPAITVELETHETIEWERNLAGVKALLNHFD
ncbi:MAG: M14 family metallopeptidase [Candidatus Paceibacterota bacterium]